MTTRAHGYKLRATAVTAALLVVLAACSAPPATPSPAAPATSGAGASPTAAPGAESAGRTAPTGSATSASPTAPAAAPRTPLAAPPSSSPSPAARPAAQELAFVKDGNIWLARLDGTSPVQLTHEAHDAEPSWAPDGSRLLFIRGSGASAELYTIAADGSGLRRLTSDGIEQRSARWAPRGGLIAYVQPRDTNGNGLAEAAEDTDVWVMHEDGAEPRRLVSGFDPAWSPDGLRLAYATNGNRQSSPPAGPTANALHLVNAQGQNDWELLAAKDVPQDLEQSYNFPFRPSTFRLRAPSWSVDGARVSASADGHTGLSLSLDDKARDIKIAVLNYEGGVGRSAFAPKGSRLITESLPASGYRRLVVSDLTGGQRVDIGSEKQNLSVLEPTWAPDGTRLAAVAVTGVPEASVGAAELLVFGADGTVQSRVAAGKVSQPAWNPAR